MLKLIDKYLGGFLRGWNFLGKRVTPRVRDQVYLILTFALLQQMTFIILAIIAYIFWVAK